MKKKTTSSNRALVNGYRSGLEQLNADVIKAAGRTAQYEEHKLEFVQPAKLRKYTPDFVFSNGVVIETKGRFVTSDRQKHLLIKQAHPDLDLRFVFSNPHQTISKTSKTTYAMWCKKHEFVWAARTIPKLWMAEKPRKKSIDAARKAFNL